MKIRLWMIAYKSGNSHHYVPDQVAPMYTLCGRYVGDSASPVRGLFVSSAQAEGKYSPPCYRCKAIEYEMRTVTRYRADHRRQ
jgi:hypothetical protein